MPTRRPSLNCPTLPNSSFSAAALLSSDSRNALCLPAYSHTGLAALQHRIICTNQLSKRLCSSATPPPTPQQLGELKVEKMQLSYTCKVPPAPILCTASNISQRNWDLLWLLKIHLEPRLQVCNARNVKVISKLSYTKGVVIVKCDGCKNNHLIGEYNQLTGQTLL